MRIWAVWVVGAAVGAICGLVCGQQSALESPELAWLLANESPPALSMRRITPKSVFLAPTFTSCSEGYRQDALGRCVKIVKINQQAQWEFFLQKLQSMYAPPAKDKPPAGPLRLPIPLGEAETTSILPLPPSTTDEPPTAGTTRAPTSATVLPTSTTDSGERPTETPLLIIVANTTEPPTTERDWTSRVTTFTSESTVQTSTDQPTMTAMVASTTDCDDCEPTTTPSSTGWFSGAYDATTTDVTTTPPSTFRPSTYLPPQFRPVIRAPTSRPKIEAQATAVLRPQWHPQLTSPTPIGWPSDPSPTGWPPDRSPTGWPSVPSPTSLPNFSYTTRRSTVRFPSERPPVASHNAYVQFPVSATAPQLTSHHLSRPTGPGWWPPTWEPSLWLNRPSTSSWSHREPRLLYSDRQ